MDRRRMRWTEICFSFWIVVVVECSLELVVEGVDFVRLLVRQLGLFRR